MNQIFKYNGQAIEFDLTSKTVMVNATEMGRIYGKQPKDFLKSRETKAFINECLNKDVRPYLLIDNEDDLVNSKQKSGTYMHRILALKFAAWLNPTFELWVYHTIDQILFGSFRNIEENWKESAETEVQLEHLGNKLKQIPEYNDYQLLKLKKRQLQYTRSRANKQQIEKFRPSDPQLTML